MPVFICESFSIKSQSEQVVVTAIDSVKLLLCPLLEVMFSLPPPIVTKTWNLAEPKAVDRKHKFCKRFTGCDGERGHSYFSSLVFRHIYSSC